MTRRLWARVLGACIVAWLFAMARVARAEDDPTATAAARERFKEGVAFFDQKQYEKARAAFLQAYALKKHPAVLLNLAQSEVRSGHERDAAEHFSTYLRESQEASAAERESAEAGLATARAAVGEIRVAVDEPGAEVLVDGASKGAAPLPDPVYVEPGAHTFEAKNAERAATQTVSIKAGERKDVRLVLAGAPAAPGAAPSAGPKPGPEPAAEAAESAEEEASTGGREPFLRWVTSRPAGFIPAGAAVLLGLGAGGFALGATIRYSDADSTAEAINVAATEDSFPTRGICNDPAGRVNSSPLYANATPAQRQARVGQYEEACTQHSDYVDQGDTFKTVALGLGIGAGVAAVATVVLYFATAPNEAESAASEAATSVAVVPWATPARAGIAVLGRF